MERRHPSDPSSTLTPGSPAAPASFGSQRDILLITCTAGWTAFVCEAVFLLILLVSPSPQPVAEAGAEARRPATPTAPVQTAQPVAPKPQPQPAPPASAEPQPATPPATPAADDTNPYTAATANVLGLPVNEPTTIVFDAIDRAAPFLDGVKAALVAGLAKGGPPIELMALQDGQLVRWNPQPKPTAPGDAASLQQFVGGLEAVAGPGFWTAVDAGARGVGQRFIFITPRTDQWGGIVNQLDQRLDRGGSSTRLDVVQLGNPVPELRAFVEGANGGRYTVVDDATLRAWSP